MAITLTALQSEYGSFYQKGSQNEKNLFTKIYREAEFDNLFTYRPTADTVVRNVHVLSNSVIQAYQKAFTPKGGGEFKPAQIDLFKVKADDSLTPDEIEESYIGFLAGEGQDKSQWPIVKWWLENILFKQFAEDIDTYGYSAVHAAPTAGTAGDSDEAFDGLGQVIKDRIADGSIPSANIIATGANSSTATTFVGQVEALVAGIPDFLRKRLPFEIMMSTTLEQRYKDGMRTKYNANYAQAQISTHIDYQNIKIVGVSAMSGSAKLLASTKANRVLAIKRPALLADIQKDGRQINLLHDHWRGYGFADTRYVFTNDQENT